MDREQLLMGLYYVRQRIDRMLGLYERERQLEVQVRDEVVGFQNTGVKGSIKSLILFLGAASIIFEVILMILFSNLRDEILPFFVATAAGYFILLPKIVSNSLEKNKLTIVAGVALFFGAMGGAIFRGITAGPIGIVLLAIVAGITVPLYVASISRHKANVNRKNEEIRERNNRIYNEYEKIEGEIRGIQKELAVEANSWYPKSYCNKEAVDWFIEAVENYRCDNIKELIREFEVDNRHHQMMLEQQRLRISMENRFDQVIRNQQEMQRLMRVQNMLAASNLAATIQNGYKIDRNTDAVNRATSAINSLSGNDVYYTPPSF